MLERLDSDLNARISSRWHQCRRARLPLAMLQLEVRSLADWREGVGEAVASNLLAELGQRLKQRVRDTDEVLPLEGGRYAVLMPGAGAPEATIVRTRLEVALAAPYRIGSLVLCPALTVVERIWMDEAAGEAEPASPRVALAG